MTLDTLSFRPVRPADKDRIIAFTFNTWGDNEDDYIKDVFDDWLADPRGEFTAAVIDDQVVGIAKLTDMGNDEWWFEGLRIDPAYRRQGIAASLSRYHVASGEAVGRQSDSLYDGRQQCGQPGHRRAGGLSNTSSPMPRIWPMLHSEFALPVLLTIEDAPALLRWIDSPLMRYLHGVYRAGWSAKTLTEAEIRRALDAQSGLWSERRGGTDYRVGLVARSR